MTLEIVDRVVSNADGCINPGMFPEFGAHTVLTLISCRQADPSPCPERRGSQYQHSCAIRV